MNEAKNKRTPLMTAALHGSTESLVEMLGYGAAAIINARDSTGATACHSAVIGGHLDTLKLLVAHGADLCIGDNGGRTALHAGAQAGGEAAILLVVLVVVLTK